MQPATARKALATTRIVIIGILLKLTITAVAYLLLADMHRLATAPL